jgi:hypothetical protein
MPFNWNAFCDSWLNEHVVKNEMWNHVRSNEHDADGHPIKHVDLETPKPEAEEVEEVKPEPVKPVAKKAAPKK